MRRQPRLEAQRRERRRSIVASARARFFGSTEAYETLTVLDIARGAGLAKGTVYLYFATKEHLFLTVLEEELAEWLERLALELAPATTPEAAADAVTRSLAGRDALLRLLALAPAVLEPNVSPEIATRFQRQRLDHFARVGRILEDALPFLAAGQGLRVMVQLHGLIVGLRQLASPAPVVAEVLEQAEFAPLAVDFLPALHQALVAWLAGLARAKSRAA